MLVETRGNDGKNPRECGLSEAILRPMASFGGLWSLGEIPRLEMREILGLSYNDLARYIFRILGFDNALLGDALATYRGFDNALVPVNYTKISENLYIQQLYNGPTRAFKDMAMQPFGSMLCALAKAESKRYLILTATSGDTGPATLEAIKGRENVYGICMYPHNATSDVQRLQMTTIAAPNVKVLAIKGDFDDAQGILKNLLKDSGFLAFLEARNFALTATNSVNFGRIIFQIIYHIYSYIYLFQNGAITQGEAIDIIVPSGNFGNALGAFYAKLMGVPIAKIIIATNANSVLFDFIKRGEYDISKRTLIKTNSPAMDILVSSNVERALFALYGAEKTREFMESLAKTKSYRLNPQELRALQGFFDAHKSDDSEALEMIRTYAKRGIIIDPHTATGLAAYNDSGTKSIVCATAEWSKFAPTIARALGQKCSGDKEALDFISKAYNLPIHANIAALFHAPESNNAIVDKDEVSATIRAWLADL